MTSSSSRWTCLSALVVLLAVPQVARAGSCCGSILSQVDRLAPSELLAVQVGLGGATGLGSDPSIAERELQLRLGAAWRLHDDFQLGVNGAWIEGFRHYGEERSTAGWFADTGISLRFEPPQLMSTAFVATATLPSGRAPEESRDRLGADATGRGAASLRIGGTWEHIFESVFVLAGGGAALRAPSRTGIDAGLSADLHVLAGWIFAAGGAISLSVAGSYTPDLARAGVVLAGSAAHRVTTTLAFGMPLSERVSLSAALVADPPVPGLSRNVPPQLAGSAGLRVLLDE